ncbi:MAG: flavodoxin [Clostridium butyricum]|nr:flavodoxin [Clostridium butyricum]
MIDLCIINGSPRRQSSNSKYLADEFITFFNKKINSKTFYVSDILKNQNIFNEILTYHNILIASPLYVDSFPSSVIQFLWEFSDFLSTKTDIHINLYGLINSGFLDGPQNRLAIEILKNFAISNNLNWKMAIGIGSGEMLKNIKSIPWQKGPKKTVYNDLIKMKNCIENNGNIDDDILLPTLKFPKRLFILIANHSWKLQCKKNYGLNPKELYKKIY